MNKSPIVMNSASVLNDEDQSDSDESETMEDVGQQSTEQHENGTSNSSDNLQPQQQQQQIRTRRKTSGVWNYFTLQPHTIGMKEQIANCNYCGHQIKYVSTSGTGGLRAHSIRCNAIMNSGGVPPDGYQGSSTANEGGNEENGGRSRRASFSGIKRKHSLGPGDSSSLHSSPRLEVGSPAAPTALAGSSTAASAIIPSYEINPKLLKPLISEFIISSNLDFSFPSSSPAFKKFMKSLLYLHKPIAAVSFEGNDDDKLSSDCLPSSQEIEWKLNLLYDSYLEGLQSSLNNCLASSCRVSLIVNLYSLPPTSSDSRYSSSHRILTVGIQYLTKGWELKNFLLSVKLLELSSSSSSEGVFVREIEIPGDQKVDQFREEKGNSQLKLDLFISQHLLELLGRYKLLELLLAVVFDEACMKDNVDSFFWKAYRTAIHSVGNKQRMTIGNPSPTPRLFLDYLSVTSVADSDTETDHLSYPLILSSIAKEILQLLHPITSKLTTLLTSLRLPMLQQNATTDSLDNWKSTVDMIYYCLSQRNQLSSSSSLSLADDEWETLQNAEKLLLLVVQSLNSFSCCQTSLSSSHLVFSSIHDISIEIEKVSGVFAGGTFHSLVNKKIVDFFHSKRTRLLFSFAISKSFFQSCFCFTLFIFISCL
jgi:hypothetical protein